MPCPLRARSDSDSGYLTVTEGQLTTTLTCGRAAYDIGAHVLLSNRSRRWNKCSYRSVITFAVIRAAASDAR